MPSKVRRVLLGTVKWTGLATVVAILLFFVANAFDEDLSPQAKALLVESPNALVPEQNLYIALLGIEARAGDSPIAAGQARLAAYESDVAAALKDPRHSPQRLSGSVVGNGRNLQFQGKIDFCYPVGVSCFAEVERHGTDIRRLLRQNAVLYRRYEHLHRLKGFRELASPSEYVVYAYPPIQVRQLYVAGVALQIKTGTRGQQQEAIRDLLDDIRIWRLQLTESRSLISMSIAAANLHGDYGLLADVIADPKVDLKDSSEAIRSALDLRERDRKIGRVLAFEHRMTVFVLERTRAAGGNYGSPEQSTWWERMVGLAFVGLKVNATQNLDAESKMRLRDMADADPSGFFAARDAYRAWRHERLDFAPHYLYNPTGKMLMNIGSSRFEDYALRTYDSAAFQRLVRLGYEIRTRRIADADVPAFIAKNPQWGSHPVDGKPFRWDRDRREIAVQPLGRWPKGRRFSIPVWGDAKS